MERLLVCLSCIALLTACGLVETAATGAAGAASDVEAAKQGIQTEERVRQQLEAAQRTAEENREAALKEADQ